MLYPQPDYFGRSTASSIKDYGVDWSDFNIMAALRGAKAISCEVRLIT